MSSVSLFLSLPPPHPPSLRLKPLSLHPYPYPYPFPYPLPHHRLSSLRPQNPNPNASSLLFRRPIRVSATGVNVDVARALRLGSVVETDKIPADVRKRTMEAVDWFGGRVTIGDVAGRTGLKLAEAQRSLQALAADTNGFLEVSDDGDVLFVFPKDYRGKLASKSFRLKFEPWVEKAKSATEYLIRFLFGTTLIASIVIVFTAIIVIMVSGKSDDDSRGRRGGRANDSGVSFYFNPLSGFRSWDLFYAQSPQRQEKEEGMNFIESVFSFVFGDGDPNQGIEEKRWKLIGGIIASNGGVVTAEELAPYLDVDTAGEPKGDDSYILQVLLQFNGEPEVDEQGNILYRFPSFQRTAVSQWGSKLKQATSMWNGAVAENVFKEKKWKFSKNGIAERAMVIGLGGLNLFGVIFLGALLRDMSGVTPNGFLKFVINVFPLLQVYAGSFFAIPLVRSLFILKTNYEIDKRNRAREQCAQALQRPDASLKRKLQSARDMSKKTVIGQDKIIYSSGKDLLEQDYDAREWERKLREVKKSD
ncbi:hypothetical protein Droror1_Dr00026325 [Drosera rotundifolia]